MYLILDLRDLNLTLWTYVLLKFIVLQIQSEDWFVTIDIKELSGSPQQKILLVYY